MAFIKLGLGILFIMLGWVYFYRPNLVLAFHQLVREKFLNDRIILLERKKVAILFFCLSFIALYMGVTSLPNQASIKQGHNWISETSSYMMYEAMQDYCREKYDNAINKYIEILKNAPDNVTALRRLSYTYEACGDTAKARVIWQKLLKIQPNNRELLKKLGMKYNGN